MKGLKIVASMPAISLLYIDGDQLTSAGLRSLSKAPFLGNLWLGDHASANFDLAILGDFPALADVTISGSSITNERLKEVAANQRLQGLHLRDCASLTDEALTTLAEMPNLERLQLMGTTTFGPKAMNDFKAKRPACAVY